MWGNNEYIQLFVFFQTYVDYIVVDQQCIEINKECTISDFASYTI